MPWRHAVALVGFSTHMEECIRRAKAIEKSEADIERIIKELQEVGPRNANPDGAVWLQLAKVESWFDTLAQAEALEADPVSFFAARGFVDALEG